MRCCLLLLAMHCGSSWLFRDSQREHKVAVFAEWMKEHKRDYPSAGEFEHRLSVFWENYLLVTRHNASGSTFTMRLNHFADMTDDEFLNRYTGAPLDKASAQPAPPKPVKKTKSHGAPIPRKINWVEKGAVTPVKDQIHCGACYAFGAIGVLEGAYFIKHGELKNFSEQMIINCGPEFEPDLHGCSGSPPSSVFSFSIKRGVWLTSDVPYTGTEDKCQSGIAPFTNLFHYQEIAGTEGLYLEWVSKAPTMMYVRGMTPSFRFYHEGVLNIVGPCHFFTTHVITLVGYDLDDKVPYMMFKNSWGTDWGDKGFGKFKLIGENTNGLCGWMNEISYALSFK